MTSLVRLVYELGWLRMHAAVVDLCTDEFLIASSASKFLQSCKHLPEDFRPCDLLLSEEEDELIDIPVFVTLMFGYNITMEINE